jgi:hypothetical protein
VRQIKSLDPSRSVDYLVSNSKIVFSCNQVRDFETWRDFSLQKKEDDERGKKIGPRASVTKELRDKEYKKKCCASSVPHDGARTKKRDEEGHNEKERSIKWIFAAFLVAFWL